MEIVQRIRIIRDRILQNPIALIFFVLFLMAEYWNYEKGTQLDTVCEAIPEPIVLHLNPKNAQEKAELICDPRREHPALN
ncbi:MAG: hypothetical protein WBW99_00945 [Pseudolabrys sp.]